MAEQTEQQNTETTKTVVTPRAHLVLLPRLSEKSNALQALNKYVFKVVTKANKVEIKKAVEQLYGVKVAQVNMVRMAGKIRRYGKTSGRTSGFKKAVVTLTPDSKKITIVEPS